MLIPGEGGPSILACQCKGRVGMCERVLPQGCRGQQQQKKKQQPSSHTTSKTLQSISSSSMNVACLGVLGRGRALGHMCSCIVHGCCIEHD
eukprot:5444603-Amphidinium_carterae.1